METTHSKIGGAESASVDLIAVDMSGGDGEKYRRYRTINDLRNIIMNCTLTPTCWEWTGFRNPDGSGRLTIGCRQVFAHRTMYEICIRNLRPHEVVMRTCHNTGCVNPAHLIAGVDNNTTKLRDKAGRQAKGSNNGRAIVDEEMVRNMRDEWIPFVVTKKMLAKKYGLSWLTVSDILARTTWKHVE